MKPLNTNLWTENGDVTTQDTHEIASFCGGGSGGGGGSVCLVFTCPW